MRRSIITTLLVVLAITFTFAQPAKGQHRGAAQAMLEALDLSPEQQEQIKAIKQTARQEMRALRGERNPANREKAKSIMEQSRQAVTAVLTPEQQVKLEEIKAAKQAAWKAVDKAGLKAELKAYREERVEPVLRASRSKLDAFIAEEDKAEIARLRGVFAKRPGQGKGMQEMRPANRNAKDQAKTAGREAAQAWRTEHAAELASLKALTKKYQAELTRVQEVLEPSRATWRKEMAAIKAKYLPEGMNGQRREKRSVKARNAATKHQGKQGVARMKAGAFLLLAG